MRVAQRARVGLEPARAAADERRAEHGEGGEVGGGRPVRLEEVREEEAHVEGLQPREERAEGQPRGEGAARHLLPQRHLVRVRARARVRARVRVRMRVRVRVRVKVRARASVRVRVTVTVRVSATLALNSASAVPPGQGLGVRVRS